MAEKKEPTFWNSIKKWATVGALGLLGIEGLLAIGVPAVALTFFLNVALTGAYYGGIAGAGIWAVNQLGKALTPSKKTA